ncbi:MAG: DUF3786 domain-containing protein [Thermodesulfobacteriota bacterium]
MGENLSFEDTYSYYLNRLKTLSFDTAASIKGIEHRDGSLFVPLLNRVYSVSPGGILDWSGRRPGFDICVVLCRYLLMARSSPPEGERWVSFRDLKDSGPLTVYFAHDVENAVASGFTGAKDSLSRAARRLGARDEAIDAGYDLAAQIEALPNIPVCVLFNDADDEFRAACSILFRPDVETRLDAECIAILGRLIYTHLVSAPDEAQGFSEES